MPPMGGVLPSLTPHKIREVVWHGGDVQTVPAIYVVFWGFTTDPAGEALRLQTFLKAVGGSPWLGTVTQYYEGGSVHVSNPTGQFKGSWIDTTTPVPAHPTDAEVAAEAILLAERFNVFDHNAAYIVATPTGHSTRGFGNSFCSYHSAKASHGVMIAYTNLPYMSDAGQACGANSVNPGAAGRLDGLTIVAGHELSEAQTDPNSGGWWDSQGHEIADKCVWYHLQNTSFGSAGTFPTQPLWSNAQSRCVQ